MQNDSVKFKTIILSIIFLGLFGWAGRSRAAQNIFFQEGFDDSGLGARGWYDGNNWVIDNTTHAPGSTGSYKCEFLSGATGCNGGETIRHAFTASNSVYLSFWVLHSASWVGSGKTYHPHEFYILTNKNDAYSGLAFNYLDAYVEENQGRPQIGLQDGQMIDTSKIGVDLTNTTENRSVTGCNGNQSVGQVLTDCYSIGGGAYRNGMDWLGNTAYFFNASAKVQWHHVEAYLQLNTISGGKGQANGIVKYWYDGNLEINHENVILRTAANPAMQFNQLVLAPYIGDGSPTTQTTWFDTLVVADSQASSGDTTPPAAPTGLTVN